MILHNVPTRDDGPRGEMQRAHLKVVHIFALAALEMIVMAKPRALVASLPVGKDHRLDALPLQQQIQRPVNSGNPEAAQRSLRALEDLLDGDGPLRLGDGLKDGIALPGMTLAERGWHALTVRVETAFLQGG